MDSLGSRIREIRKRAGLNQKGFAAEVGIKQSYLSEIETNKKTPSEMLVKTICYRWGYNPDWILKGDGDPKLVAGGSEFPAPGEAGPSRGDYVALERWLNRDPEMRDLLVGWARARTQGLDLKVDAGDLVETIIKALASKLLEGLKESGDKIPEG